MRDDSAVIDTWCHKEKKIPIIYFSEEADF